MAYNFKTPSSIKSIIKYIILGGVLTFSNVYALPSTTDIIQIQKIFENKTKSEKSKYLSKLYSLAIELKNVNREKESETIILKLAEEKFYQSLSPAIKIYIKYQDLENAERLNSLYKSTEYSYILGKINFKGKHKKATKKKAYLHFKYASDKGHINSNKFLKKHFKTNIYSQKTEKDKHNERTKYYNISKKYDIIKTLEDLKKDKVIEKDKTIEDLKALSILHYEYNFKKDSKIDSIRTYFKIKKRIKHKVQKKTYD